MSKDNDHFIQVAYSVLFAKKKNTKDSQLTKIDILDCENEKCIRDNNTCKSLFALKGLLLNHYDDDKKNQEAKNKKEDTRDKEEKIFYWKSIEKNLFDFRELGITNKKASIDYLLLLNARNKYRYIDTAKQLLNYIKDKDAKINIDQEVLQQYEVEIKELRNEINKKIFIDLVNQIIIDYYLKTYNDLKKEDSNVAIVKIPNEFSFLGEQPVFFPNSWALEDKQYYLNKIASFLSKYNLVYDNGLSAKKQMAEFFIDNIILAPKNWNEVIYIYPSTLNECRKELFEKMIIFLFDSGLYDEYSVWNSHNRMAINFNHTNNDVETKYKDAKNKHCEIQCDGPCEEDCNGQTFLQASLDDLKNLLNLEL